MHQENARHAAAVDAVDDIPRTSRYHRAPIYIGGWVGRGSIFAFWATITTIDMYMQIANDFHDSEIALGK